METTGHQHISQPLGWAPLTRFEEDPIDIIKVAKLVSVLMPHGKIKNMMLLALKTHKADFFWSAFLPDFSLWLDQLSGDVASDTW